MVDKNRLVIQASASSYEYEIDLQHLDLSIAITGTIIKVLNGGNSREVSGQYGVFRPNVFVEVLQGKLRGIFEKFAIDAISDISRKHVVCEISLTKIENPYKRYCRENVKSSI